MFNNFRNKFFVIFLFILMLITPAFFSHAEFSSIPDRNLYAPNGTVSAVVSDNDYVYIAGAFGAVGKAFGRGFSVNAGTGLSDFNESSYDSFPVINGDVYRVVSDGNGGWFVGGNFTKVGSYTRTRFVHILSDNTVNEEIDFSFNALINAMALSSDNSTLYIGGQFTTVNGITRNRVAAIDLTTNQLKDFHPNISNNGVDSMVLSSDDSILYIGGNFRGANAVNGNTTRSGIASFTTTNGLVTSFDPNIAAGAVNNRTYSIVLSSDDSILYAVGDFTAVGGSSISRNRAAAFTTSDGLATSFNPNLGGSAYSVDLNSTETRVYIGGVFTTVNGGASRARLASFSASDGTVSSFNANITSGEVDALKLDSNDVVYTGGTFQTVNTSVSRSRAAAFDTDGLVTSFNPNLSGSVYSLDLSEDESKVFVGGLFSSGNFVSRTRIAKIDKKTGLLDPNFSPSIDNTVSALSLSPDESVIYAGGSFTTINSNVTRNRLVAFSTSDGSILDFNPNITDGAVSALYYDSTEDVLYAGGTFTTVNGVTNRNRLASFNILDGLVTSFNPNLNSSVLGLNGNGGYLYVGGQFTTINGGSTTINRIAKFDLSDGSFVSGFNPNIADGAVYSFAFDNQNDLVYAGGTFTNVNGSTPRNRLAGFNISNGNVNSFNPNVGTSTITSIALTPDANTLYVGGAFTTVNGSVTRNRLASFNTSDGIVTDFDPNFNSTVNVINLSNGSLHVGGAFSSAGGDISFIRFISFSDNIPPVVSISAPSVLSTITGPVTYTISFSGADEINLSDEDITLNTTGTATGTVDVTGSGLDERTVTISNITGDGTLSISIDSGVASDLAGNESASPDESDTFDVDNTPPVLEISAPSSLNTTTGPVTYTITFTGADTITLSNDDITLNTTGTATGTVDVTGTGLEERTVTITGMDGEGNISITIASGVASDEIGNLSLSTGPSEDFIFDNVAPIITEAMLINTTTQKSPNYVFHSDESGEITYGGSCSSTTTNAVVGNNTITLNELPVGIYSDCTILVTDSLDNESNLLNITSFDIVNANSGGGSYLSPTMLKNLNISVDPKYSPWLQANSPNTSSVVLDTISASTFPRLLRTGMTGQDVKELQKLLNQKGFTVSQTGAGSVGNETTFFGVKTRDALVRFQRANTPLSVDGLFGPKSRDVLIK
jgi:hypothetical protein